MTSWCDSRMAAKDDAMPREAYALSRDIPSQNTANGDRPSPGPSLALGPPLRLRLRFPSAGSIRGTRHRGSVALGSFYAARPADARKGDFGHVLVAGGSERYAGAVAFNALAALRAGADLATLVAPTRAADLAAGYGPDLITVPCGAPFPEPRVVASLQERCDVLVLGGGVERTALAHKAMREIVEEWRKPMVLDAEALHALTGANLAGKRAVVTPHGGEFQVLAGSPWPADAEERKTAASALARKMGCVVLVKGAFDVVADDERAHVDEFSSPFLTKGGHGDLLAGAVGALLARRPDDPFAAASAGAELVGRAGAIAGRAHGESTLASDTLAAFAQAIRDATD